MLSITLSGHHVELTEALNAYVHKKMDRLERHLNDITSVHVVLGVEHLEHTVKATVSVQGGVLQVHAQDKNMYAAIDKMIDDLDRQAIRHKEKRDDKRHGGTCQDDSCA